MRNLRAELRDWDDNVPIPWTPSECGVLVGYVRKSASFDSNGRALNNVIVEEERSGILMVLDLASEQLAALFELHSPRLTERIGIKCLGTDESGNSRYVLLIDRGDYACSSHDTASSNSCLDEDCHTTTEERNYITELLNQDDNTNDVSTSSESGSNRRITGLIQRSQDELVGDERALERLEAMVTGSAKGGSRHQEAIMEESSNKALGEVAPPVRKKGRRIWAWILVFILLVSASLATAVFYYKLPFPW